MKQGKTPPPQAHNVFPVPARSQHLAHKARILLHPHPRPLGSCGDSPGSDAPLACSGSRFRCKKGANPELIPRSALCSTSSSLTKAPGTARCRICWGKLCHRSQGRTLPKSQLPKSQLPSSPVWLKDLGKKASKDIPAACQGTHRSSSRPCGLWGRHQTDRQGCSGGMG